MIALLSLCSQFLEPSDLAYIFLQLGLVSLLCLADKVMIRARQLLYPTMLGCNRLVFCIQSLLAKFGIIIIISKNNIFRTLIFVSMYRRGNFVGYDLSVFGDIHQNFLLENYFLFASPPFSRLSDQGLSVA